MAARVPSLAFVLMVCLWSQATSYHLPKRNEIKICSPQAFLGLVYHLCSQTTAKEPKKLPLAIPDHEARGFLLQTNNQHKRDLFGRDVYYADECCSVKGCEMEELIEYCPYMSF